MSARRRLCIVTWATRRTGQVKLFRMYRFNHLFIFLFGREIEVSILKIDGKRNILQEAGADDGCRFVIECEKIENRRIGDEDILVEPVTASDADPQP